ncbi:chemotaxis protein CheY [Pseudomonas fluorescens HK44]|uniref:histidine kinase n=1 Tax=Pseudomonas fluorescens HK44 TaxID=1042209 RepID=A0A010SS07_PSEFL|nr:hybrid sensor histidine kinase/response regulator [Pseudomonas fluorescens]EXF95610.1 chemotaxis protein CheY [Pseudomonas fluorescens HK44]
MKHESLKLGALALSSQRLNKLLLILAGLTLLLVGMCYWAIDRVLEEERDKVDFHFARLIESVHEYETFLRNVASAYDRTNQNMMTDIRPMSRVEIMQKSDERVFQNRGLAMSQPFTLSERIKYSEAQLQGAYSLGVQLTDYYSTFWSSSHYSAPQTFLFSPSDQFNIAIPGVDGTRTQAALLKSNFFEVTNSLYQELLAQRSLLNDRRVRWTRAPAGLLNGTKTIVAFIGVDITPSIMPARQDKGLLTFAALLDAGQINDLDRLRVRQINNRVTLISPTGDVLLGESQDQASVPMGLSFDGDGLRFKVNSSGPEQWVGLYAVSYENFFRYAQWPLLGVAGVFLLALLLGWRVNRWYRGRIVEPAQRANRRLTESEAFNRAMLQSAPVGLCVVQRNNSQVLLENQRAQEWQGTAELISLLKRDYSDEEPREVQIEVAGRYLLACFMSTRYQGEDVVLCGFNDITRHVDDALLMEQAKRAADDASAAKTLFLATMSHEIRTPLYGVLGNLELLGLTDLNARQRDYLQTIERSSSVLFQLISDVLDISKIESGQMALETTTFSPLDVFEDAVRSYAASATNKGLQVLACADATLPALMSGDPGRIRQIVNNLLSNAIKFTDSGRVVLRLKVTDLDQTHASLQWQVSDTGMGISDKQLAGLFKPFSQISGSERAGGAGLGLSICARLSKLMGANLRVVSEPGLGSSFSLHLRLPIVAGLLPDCADIDLDGLLIYVRAPLKELEQSLIDWLNRWGARATPLPDGYSGDAHSMLLDVAPNATSTAIWHGQRITVSDLGQRQPQQTSQGWTVNPYDIRSIARALSHPEGAQPLEPHSQDSPPRIGLRVLVVEDNPINRAILQEQLEALGARVVTAEDGEEALQRWSPDAFDLVITDINMPRLNGYELTRALREHNARMPIIGVTANALREEGEQCLAAGMNAWVVKPLSLKVLRQTLLSHCGHFINETGDAPVSQQRGDMDGWISLSPAMHQLFISTMQEDMSNTEQALDEANTPRVVRHLHRMNGSLASVCASSLSAACNTWEKTLQHGSLDAASTAQVRVLLQRLDAVLLALKANSSSDEQPSNGR